ncbi:MAG: hypothetical protein Q9M92_03760 [Enterobacterales bacterium]|nr:hypothetical protein [Enterobacterales bacterium]
MSETYKCIEHPLWSEDKKFKAVLDISETKSAIIATINALSINAAWPLDSSCDKPIVGAKLIGVKNINELKLSLANEKECGFVLYLSVSANNPTLLSPRRSYKVFGEKPYLAKCNKL